MKIRKEFRVESSHIVRNCTSHRCSHSVHGHSAVIEVILEGTKLDNAGMLYDFGLMKSTIKEFIDSSDHCHLICEYDKPEYIKFFTEENDRWIMLPFNPSAEMLSLYYFHFIQLILNNTIMNNGEGDVKVKSVRYHETTTGWAECDQLDHDIIWDPEWDDKIFYSKGITNEWSKSLISVLTGNKIENPIIKQQMSYE
jgi:6-pyruvoyltetrahydropterin/6-carboxytetrahydropterin synthase